MKKCEFCKLTVNDYCACGIIVIDENNIEYIIQNNRNYLHLNKKEKRLTFLLYKNGYKVIPINYNFSIPLTPDRAKYLILKNEKLSILD